MSYQVLARKWRPRVFREMIGQEHVLRALINALDHNRLHHAYLFTGTRGVGKTSIARILAKCLNCETGVSSEPCDECSACLEISQGRFVDLIEVDAASRTKVEDTRELLDNVQYAPSRGRFKIYLIDEVHMLSNHSFNALLKTLEEPPEHVKFLLATTDPQKLPVTILSRCLQFNLKNLSPEKIVGHLSDVLQKEAIPFEEAALWLLARSADGSMRDALSLTDQGISFGGGKVSEPEVASMLGTIDHKLIEQLIVGLIENDGSAILNAVDAFAEHAPDFDIAMADLITLLHRIAIAQAMPDALDNSYGDKAKILGFAAALTPEDVQMFYQTALIGRRDLSLSPALRAGFEMTLLRMLAFKPQGVADVPFKKLDVNNENNNASDEQNGGIDTEKKPELASPDNVSEPKTANALAPSRHSSQNTSISGEHKRLDAIDDDPSLKIDDNTSNENVSFSPPQSKDAPAKEKESLASTIDATEQDAVDNKTFLREQVKKLVGKEGFNHLSTPIHGKKNTNNIVNSLPKPDLASDADTADFSKKIELNEITPTSWPRLYPRLKIKGLLQSTVSNTLFIGRQEKLIDFALDEKKASLFDDSHSERLSDHLTDYFGEPIKARIYLQKLNSDFETPAMFSSRITKEKHANAVAVLYDDPVVQTLQAEFGAQLDEASVVAKE